MTTLRQIIIDSLRESGVVAVGDTPDGDVHTEALSRLQKLIKSLYGNELGEPLASLDYEDILDYEAAPENSRIIFDLDSAVTVDLPENPRDGARFGVIDVGGTFATYNLTLDGNGRHIESAATQVLNTNSLNRAWLYRADLGNWARVTDLTASDESPFPEEFDDYLVLLLAMRLNPRYGAETKGETIEAFNRARRQFRARYRQNSEQNSEEALLRLSGNRQPFFYE